MRVVVVSAWEPWRTSDGAAFVLDHQLRELAGRHELTVLCAGAPRAEAAVPVAVAGRYGRATVRWFGTSTPAGFDYLRRLLWSARRGEPAHVRFVERPGLLTAYDAAVAAGADVVHLHGWGTAQLAERAWAKAVPAVHMAIDPWTENARNRRVAGFRAPLERRQLERIARHEARHYAAARTVAGVTDGDAEVVRRLSPRAAVEVLPNGVEPGPEPAPVSATPPVLGFHGVYDSRANVEAATHLVNDIWPRVRAEIPAAKVLLVGRRPNREVRRLVGSGVELRADVPDIRAVLLEMSVHVDWMTSGAGIKNKVLEAMAAGRPVVASEMGARGIGGVLVAADTDVAAARIVRLLRDPAALRAAGETARAQVVANFSWAANARHLEQLWQRAAGRPVGDDRSGSWR
ncbi:MAG TPA: glycosyltransferase family 4 protein [Mycobacteriales bacterium]|nr:glycosyltransferase family 4 protein [Mycobacteriales bacterium]